MPNLLERVLGFPEGSSGRRPQMAEFTGINWNAPTAYNMLACFPMWEPPGVPALDLGPLALIGYPIGTILRTLDNYFGDVYLGDGVQRGYKIPYCKELNFGIGPQPFSLSFWYNAPVNLSPATDVYLMTNDDPGQANFPGFAVSFDSGGTIAVNTGAVGNPDVGFKTTNNVFQVAGWHHLAFSHLPYTATNAINTYYVDGQLNGQAQAASIGPVAGTVPMYIGVDDDGLSQPFGGPSYFCDLRIYKDALSDDRAAAMYHPDTRWEIYTPARKRYFLVGPSAAVATRGLFGRTPMNGLGVGGPFFPDPMAA